MILFAEDWSKYPDATVDLKTGNRSYIRLAKMYQEMGVRNCVFHLSLLQPELLGVDPHAPDLTIEQIAMIKEESRLNPWYFFREVIRLPPASGDEPVYFDINRGACAAWWNYLSHQDYNLTQPRQTGKSTSTNVVLVWLLFIVYRKTTVFLLTKDNVLRTENVDQIKKIQDLLPGYINPKTKKDLENTQVITCQKWENKLITAVPQNSELAANKTGRGLRCATYVIDEGPFISYLEKSARSMLAGGTKAMPMAAKAGMPYGVIYTTTAGSKADPDGAYYYKMVMGGVVWDESFLDLKDGETLRQFVRDNRTGTIPIINITMSHLQLGYDDKWLRETMERVGSTGDDANKDFFNVWSDGAFESPLDRALTKIIRMSECDPDHIEVTKEGYALRWYIPKHTIEQRLSRGKYILGCDPSSVVGNDNMALVMLDSSTLEVICTMTVNTTIISRYVGWLVEFMLKYENTIIIPERRSSGDTIIGSLLIAFTAKGIDPTKRIFNTLIDTDQQHKLEGRQLISGIKNNADVADKSVKYFGYATSGGGTYSRTALYDLLYKMASYVGPTMKDKNLVAELLGLSKRKGRIDHSVLGHDDSVIATLLAFWFLSNARNLNYYGIENPMFEAVDHHTRMRHGEGGSSAEDVRKEVNLQRELKKEIDHIIDLIKNSNDQIRILSYEAKLRRLARNYNPKEDDTLSVDAMIKQAKEAKRNNRRFGDYKLAA